jgi:xylitol oxidase
VQNWAENVTYHATEIAYPESLDQLRRIVAERPAVKALGSRHAFNDSADTYGTQVSLARMPAAIEVDGAAMSVTCSAGVTHAELSASLHARGLALANLASLPHLSVGGAIQTGTHGSGAQNPSLSAAVTAIELVDSAGELRRINIDHPDFDAVVVGLGAFGVVHTVTQRVVPAFDVDQRVFVGAPWERVLPALDTVMGGAYSVSLFTRFDTDHVSQIWVKRRTTDPLRFDPTTIGAEPATESLHPVPDTPADNVTEQLGRPGPSHERLPHFRSNFKPSRGDEIQAEYLLDARRGSDAISAVRRLAADIAPLLHIAEIRRVAADTAWISPARGRDSIAIHFTWRSLPDDVFGALRDIEAALLPLGARPHWGKVFTCGRDALAEAYPRLGDFADLVGLYDPTGKFDNAFLRSVLSPGDEAS